MDEVAVSKKRVPLPEAEGPRLPPFPTRHGKEPEIEFLQHLGTGATAHVFEARIDQKTYALKIVSFARLHAVALTIGLTMHYHSSNGNSSTNTGRTRQMNIWTRLTRKWSSIISTPFTASVVLTDA